MQDHWSDILHSESPQARHLNLVMEDLKTAGLKAIFNFRHGNPVHEILEEVEIGEYQMIGLGSAYSTHSLRHLHLLNVTAEVSETVDLPVLAVRQNHELIR